MNELNTLLTDVRRRSIDHGFIDQELLDVERKVRTSAFPWRGQFTPALVDVLIDVYGTQGGTVLDPFAGTGTTLLESVRRLRPCIGAEVNPAAVALTSVVSLASLHMRQRDEALATASQLVAEIVVNGCGLFADASAASDDVAASLARASRLAGSSATAHILTATLLLACGDRAVAPSNRVVRALRQVTEVLHALPERPVECRVLAADARSLPLEDAKADLILTSPPYINVFNYHQNYRQAVESIGHDVLAAAKSEIGSNRRNRQNRFLTVVQYAMDMACALAEINRVTKLGALQVFVVGRESRVRGVPFENGHIIACLAKLSGGSRLVRWHERKFVNRFGTVIFEEVLVFEATARIRSANLVSHARELGVTLLRDAYMKASGSAVSEIDAAIEKANEISLSPMLGLSSSARTVT